MSTGPRLAIRSRTVAGDRGYEASCRGGCGHHDGVWTGPTHWSGKGDRRDEAAARKAARLDLPLHPGGLIEGGQS